MGKSGIQPSVYTFSSDRPISLVEEDKFGFGLIADNLSQSVLSGGVEEGLVIGIEGKWGSGKSSLLNLLCGKVSEASNVSVIKFEPWIIGDRDSLVANLILAIGSKIGELTDTLPESAAKKAVETSEMLKAYGIRASRGLAPIAKFLDLLEVPFAGKAAKGLSILAEAEQTTKSQEPLSEMKDALIENLRDLNHRFLVVVDDMDRLEPKEAAEVVRLIRAVGDFPNIIYLLCYDKEVLAASLQNALQIDDGNTFLQKIVQVSFSLPQPEAFDLRRLLTHELVQLYESVLGRSFNADTDAKDRLAEVCDRAGGAISTPREIGLIANSLKLIFPAIAERVDYPDLCWLHIVKVSNPKLYSWIESYSTTYAAITEWATIDDASKQECDDELLKLLNINPNDSEDLNKIRRLRDVSNHLSGIKSQNALSRRNLSKEYITYNPITNEQMAKLEASNRLASPQHYKLYFSFNQPSGALSNEVYNELIGKLKKGEDIAALLEGLIQTQRPQGGTKYELLVDRLQRSALSELSLEEAQNLLLSIANTIDTARAKERDPGAFRSQRLYLDARLLLNSVLEQIPENERTAFLKKIFSEATSIGWLLAELIGHEIFAHGRVGNKQHEYDSTFTVEELDMVIDIVMGRLKGNDRSQITGVPDKLSFLYRWVQAGGEEDCKKWIGEQSKSDSEFLKLLTYFQGWAASDKVYHPLHQREVEYFFDDVDAILSKIAKIAKSGKTETGRELAQELLEAVQLGDWDKDVLGRHNLASVK